MAFFRCNYGSGESSAPELIIELTTVANTKPNASYGGCRNQFSIYNLGWTKIRKTYGNNLFANDNRCVVYDLNDRENTEFELKYSVDYDISGFSWICVEIDNTSSSIIEFFPEVYFRLKP